VTDEELEAALTTTARLDRDTNGGVVAMFALATRLDAERQEFACPPRMVLSGRGSHSFAGEYAAQCMLKMVRGGRAPADAVAWMKKAVATTRGVGGAVKALYGVTCTEPIALADDIVLLPFAQLGQSETRDWILDQHNRANSAMYLMVHGYTAPPAAALYRAGSYEPFFVASGSTLEYQKLPPGIWFEELDTAALLLALTPKAVPSEVAHWFHHDDPDVALFGQRGVTRYSGDLSSSPFRMSDPPVMVTPGTAAGVLTEFRRLQADDRDRVALALERLIRSRNQLHSGNRAIDLAIALEVLFMNADRDEHSYKIAMRLSKLLHADAADRRVAFLETRRLYDVRSKMVHAGRIKKDQWNVGAEKRNSYELVEAADVRATHSIRKLMERGNIPDADDWTEIELA
jgi:hypothetical protein